MVSLSVSQWFGLVAASALLSASGICSPAQADSLSAFSDEFDRNSRSEWQPLDPSVFRADIGITSPGHLTVIPGSCVWVRDQRGAMLYKSVTGDFIVTTRVTTRSLYNPARPPTQPFNCGGLIARDASSRPGRENWVLVAAGFIQGSTGTEVKYTINSNSQLFEQRGASSGELRLCRTGARFTMLRRLDGEPGWTFIGWMDRPDMPQTLQVGLMCNGGNGARPNLAAEFDYVRFSVPRTQADLVGEASAAARTDAIAVDSSQGNGGRAGMRSRYPRVPADTRQRPGLLAAGILPVPGL